MHPNPCSVVNFTITAYVDNKGWRASNQICAI